MHLFAFKKIFLDFSTKVHLFDDSSKIPIFSRQKDIFCSNIDSSKKCTVNLNGWFWQSQAFFVLAYIFERVFDILLIFAPILWRLSLIWMDDHSVSLTNPYFRYFFFDISYILAIFRPYCWSLWLCTILVIHSDTDVHILTRIGRITANYSTCFYI